jgi:hypothetical protein
MAENSENDPMVAAPGGPRRLSTLQQIEHGHSIDMSTGRILKRHTASGRIVDDFGPVPSKEGGDPQTVQWIVYATFNPNARQIITSFKTTWVVPPSPKTNNGQLLFLFNALQNTTGWIYQPVLQWGSSSDHSGDGGGNFWTIASWFVSPFKSGKAFFTPLFPVNTGDTLTAIMTMTGNRTVGGSTVFDWDCVFEGFPGTCFPIRGVPLFNNAVETLEAYDSTRNLPPDSCSDYPFVLKTSMVNIEVRDEAGVISVPWQAVQRITKCGQNCAIVSSNDVDINYYSPSAPAVPKQHDRLTSGQGILVNQSLTSLQGSFTLTLQADGNLVLFGPEKQIIWDSNTAGHFEIWSANFVGGQIILRDVLNGVIWASQFKTTAGDTLVVSSNGNLVITGNDILLWESNANVPIIPVQPAGNELLGGQGLVPGGDLPSSKGEFLFTLQNDGNLVLYGPQKQPMWDSNTAGDLAIWSLILQNDGNLVIYDVYNNPRWASNTAGHVGSHLTVQDDGNVVIYNVNNTAIWATNTVVPQLPSLPAPNSSELVAGQGLFPGTSVKSSNGRFTFTLQTDGNVVLYGPQNQPLWASNTNGHDNPWSLFMQNDGNLVAYDTHNGVIWASGTEGHNNSTLQVQDDGNAVIYNVNDTAIWATDTVVPSEPGNLTKSDRIFVNQGLTAGSSITSSNGNFVLNLQLDGNIVLTGPSPCFQVLWASNTAGHYNVWSLVMQSDGNFVAYDAHNKPYFATNTVGKGGNFVVVQDSGNVVMFNSQGTDVIWSTGPGLPPTPSQPSSTISLGEGEGIIGGQTLTSQSGQYTLTLQTDGNIVLYGPGQFNPTTPPPVVWASNSNGHLVYPWFLVMQGDGNFVAYDSDGNSYWASNTEGSGGTTMTVLNSGHIQISNSSGNEIWQRP